MRETGSVCRSLGRTGISVFPLGFGCWALGSGREGAGYGPTDDDESLAAVRKAFDLGCRFFDTADWYGHGHSEILLGKAIESVRDQVFIATKAGIDFYTPATRMNFTPEYLRFALLQSLSRLRSGYVDVFLLHNPPVEAVYAPEVIDMLMELKQEGKAHHIGVSALSASDAMQMIGAGWIEIIQIPYNLLSQEDSWLVFDKASALGIGIVVREILANGMLTERGIGSRSFPPNDIRSGWDPSVFMHISESISNLKNFCRPGESITGLAVRFALEPSQIGVALIGCKTVDQTSQNFGIAHSLFSSL